MFEGKRTKNWNSKIFPLPILKSSVQILEHNSSSQDELDYLIFFEVFGLFNDVLIYFVLRFGRITVVIQQND